MDGRVNGTAPAGPKTLVIPAPRTLISFDADARRLGPDARPAPASAISLSFFDPLALPRVVLDPDGQYRADFDNMTGFLAGSWTHNPELTEWTVHLRRGALSHYGNELSAEDVKWSFDRVYALRGVGLWRNRNVAGLPSADALTVLDEQTVVYRFPKPRPNWPRYWAFATGCVFDSVEARAHATDLDPWATEFLAANTCGFGPFRLERQDENELVGAAHDGYWGGRPGIDRIIFRRAGSREEAVAGFERGDYNLIAGLDSRELRRAAAVPGAVPVIAKTNQAQIDFDWKSPPLDDRRLRQAILIALPYGRIISEGYDGLARPGRGPLFDICPEYEADYWPYPRDLDRARSLVRAANAEGIEIELAVGDDVESRTIAGIIVEALAEIGLKIRSIPKASVPAGQVAQMWLVTDSPHGIVDALYNLAHEYDPPRGHHRGRFIRDPELAGRLHAIDDLPAPEQSAGYRGLSREIVDLAPKAFLANNTFLICYRDDVDPWVTSGAFAGYRNMLWSVGRSMLPGHVH